MSIDFMNRVWWREDLATMEKFVMLALADSASDDEGLCYPAVATIALKCSCSPRTVQNALRALEAKQLLRVMPRKDRSSYYILNRANLPHVERERRTKERGPQHDLSTGAGDSPQLFGTGAANTVTGESSTVTGAAAAPRTIIETSLNHQYITEAEIVDAFVDRWQALSVDIERFKPIGRIGDKRTASLIARVREYVPKLEREPVIALLDRVFATVRGSRFLRGEMKPFKASPEWMLTPTYFPKLEETGYAQDAVAGGGGYEPAGGRSHVAAGQAVRDILDARGGTPRRSARELAGGTPRRAARADR
jgi:hypothetical protein